MIEHLEDVVEKQPKPRGLQGSAAVVLLYFTTMTPLEVFRSASVGCVGGTSDPEKGDVTNTVFMYS